METRPSGLTVSVAVSVTVPEVAVIVTWVAVVTVPTVILNDACDSPWLTVTVAGTVAAVELLARVTTMPPLGARPES